MKKLLLLSFSVMAILLNACATTAVISNTIPAEMQQGIRTVKIGDMNYSFIGHPNGDKVTAAVGVFESSFNINVPLNGLMKELVETKFGNISPNSKNELAVTLKDIKYVKEYANTK